MSKLNRKSVEDDIKNFLKWGVKVEDIDGHYINEVIYQYPQLWIRFMQDVANRKEK